MPAAAPQTITNDLLAELQALVRAGRILAPNDPDLQHIVSKAKGLQYSVPKEYYAVQSVIETMQGNRERAEAALRGAKHVGLDVDWVLWSRVVQNLRLWFASDAQKAISEYQNIVAKRSYEMAQEARAIASSLLATGAFQALGDFYPDESATPVIAAERVLSVQRIQDAAALLRDQGVDDKMCAKVIDVAGEVMRKHKLLWPGSPPELVVDYDASTVGLHFSINTTVAKAIDMMDEVTDCLIDRDLDRVPLLVLFRGTEI